MTDQPEDDDYKSRTEIKREMHAIEDLGRQLAKMSKGHLNQLPLNEETRAAIIAVTTMRKGAKVRQFRFLRSLLEREDLPAIYAKIESIERPSQMANARFHVLENQRDQLLAGDEQTFEKLVTTFSSFDRQHVRALVRNAIQEAKAAKPPKSSRALFQYLRELQDSV